VTCTVRPMREEDIPRIMELEEEAFPTQIPGLSFHRELTNKLARYVVACAPTEKDSPSASGGQEVVGYAGLWFVLDEAHLIAIAVKEEHRNEGIGHCLLFAAMDEARAHASTLMTLEVRVSNKNAHALYEKFGFKRVGVRKGYYSDNHEDAFLMTVEPIDSEEHLQRLSILRAEKPGYPTVLLAATPEPNHSRPNAISVSPPLTGGLEPNCPATQ